MHVKYHVYTNKIRHTYVRDVRQLSNPAKFSGKSFKLYISKIQMLFKISQLIIIDLKTPSNMISFINIIKNIYYIRGTSKQKATTERILNLLRKKGQYRDLPFAFLEE